MKNNSLVLNYRSISLNGLRCWELLACHKNCKSKTSYIVMKFLDVSFNNTSQIQKMQTFRKPTVLAS